MNAVAEALLTAEEFSRSISPHTRDELVRGLVVRSPFTGFQRGCVAVNLIVLLRPLVNLRWRIVGRVGVVLSRDPDTVRGPGASCYLRDPNQSTVGYPIDLPEAVFEVRSPSDTWPEVLNKVAEYLAVGIVAIVLDPRPRRVHIFEPGQAERRLGSGDVFDLPSLWPNLSSRP